MFAFYGDYMRWDGLIERLVYYRDDNYKDLIECHDFYQRRKDMLKKRIYYIKEMKVLFVGLKVVASPWQLSSFSK
jgi:hypothetical protein